MSFHLREVFLLLHLLLQHLHGFLRFHQKLRATHHFHLPPQDSNYSLQYNITQPRNPILSQGKTISISRILYELTLAGTSIVSVIKPCLPSWRMPCNQLNGYLRLPLLSQKIRKSFFLSFKGTPENLTLN